MKIITILLFTILLIAPLPADNNEEFRAIWVVTWEHINRYESATANKARVRQILDNLKKANMNAVLWQARQSGTAYYNSSYEPWGYYAGYEYPGYDPLAYAIEEAHKRGIELHAWFNVFQTSSTHAGTPAAEHPEWICTNEDGAHMTSYRCVSPGLEAVREYTVNVAMEIVRNYDIDGLHLDYVRWNEYDEDDMINPPGIIEQIRKMDGMIQESKLNKLSAEQGYKRYIYDVDHPYGADPPGGFDTWADWRRWTVTEFVHTLHDSIQSVKPWVRLSPAALGKYKKGETSGWNGYYIVFQDAALWFNEGYVEQLTPMHYHWLSGSSMKAAIEDDWENAIKTGTNAGRLYSVGPGSYLLQPPYDPPNSYDCWDNHPGIVSSCRELSFVDGFQFFSYASWEDQNYWEGAKAGFFQKMTKIRPAIIVSPPEAPLITLNKIDSLNYEITVTPSSPLAGSHWCAVYRSEDEIFNVGADEIIGRQFGADSFLVNDSFTGAQDYNGKYNYFATILNRYWNESAISNVETSDSIPSFCPTVISTSPPENGEMQVNNPIEIRFSKTMDTANFISAVSLSPEVAISEITWTNGNKTAAVTPAEYLQYKTDYTLTIQPTVKDINGKLLDGNGDGTGGDAFVLNFSTKPEDQQPPVIIYSNPDHQVEIDDFDTRDIITIVFNELLDPSTINDNTIALYQISTRINIAYQLFTTDEKSVLTVQPEQPLENNKNYTFFLKESISDTIGNEIGEMITIKFSTSSEDYIQTTMIDDFTSPGGWWQPNGSGSTTGIIVSETEFVYTGSFYLPTTAVHKAACLQYQWNDTASSFLIREYLPYNDPKNVEFDTSCVLQSYVYGDGSDNKFRFCIDEAHGADWPDHEVSKWITIDWYGWKLIEWKLSDPNSVGSWIGNGQLDGTNYRIDSYQLTHDPAGSISGKIYFDDFRLAKKSIASIGETVDKLPESFTLYQNYPNPFNASTTIKFYLAKAGQVSLKIYNMLGQEVHSMNKGRLPAGSHKAVFNAANLSSGLYVYEVITQGKCLRKKMMLIK
ncbi:MAG: family 10 glycosylhydrolase [Calditrichales bacterium]|nr:family 10 glycosylhydrolase [Calditrichales bacterium]